MTLKKYSILLGAILFCASCTENKSYDYLMQHPRKLEKEYSACLHDASAACNTVRRAAKDFTAFLYEQQHHPEWFGEKIMKTQLALSVLNEEMKKTSDAVTLKKLQDEYAEQCTTLKQLYAVMSLSTPE